MDTLASFSDLSYQFADLTMNVGQRRVFRVGGLIELSKLSFDFLQVLVESAPNVVTHDDLATKVWVGRNASPETINQRAKMLRRALNDEAEHPRYFEVVRGQGYRLLPSVTTVPSSVDHLSLQPDPGSKNGIASYRSVSSRTFPVVVALLVGMGIVLAFDILWPGTDSEPPAVNRFEISLPDGTVFGTMGRPVLALSRDGRRFIFNSASGFYVREMGELEARLIPAPGNSNPAAPTFSPDGSQIAYVDDADGVIKRISLSGGAPVVVAPTTTEVAYLSWEPDAGIWFGQAQGIFRVPSDGGTPELVIPSDEDAEAFEPRLLPDGDTVIFRRVRRSAENRDELVVASLSTGESKVLVRDAGNAMFVPSGHLLFARGETLLAAPFDLEKLEVTGGAVPVVQGVMRNAYYWGAANYGVSDEGTLVYVSGGFGPTKYIPVWVDRDGREDAVDIEPSAYVYPRVSPDGTRLALDDRNVGGDLWVWDFAGKTRTRLTIDDYGAQYPVWTSDGARIAYQRRGRIIEWKHHNNAGPPELLASEVGGVGAGRGASPYFFSPDGKTIVFRSQGNTDTKDDIGMVGVGGDSELVWLLRRPFNERNAELSSDGHWMAYQSDETGRYEIYVCSFPDVTSSRRQVSNEGGIMPLWSRDGQELYYVEPGSPDRMISVSVHAAEAEIFFGQRKPILDWPYEARREGRQYDVSPDGERFLAIRQGDSSLDAPRITIVQNWFEDLKRLVPAE